jgi:hypothetical protein
MCPMLLVAVSGAVFVVAAMVLGIGLGVFWPLRVGAGVPGFATGMLRGALFELAVSMLTAHLFGGWGEALLGTDVGVPLGIFVGCFVGAAASCFTFGAVGALVSRLRRSEASH